MSNPLLLLGIVLIVALVFLLRLKKKQDQASAGDGLSAGKESPVIKESPAGVRQPKTTVHQKVVTASAPAAPVAKPSAAAPAADASAAPEIRVDQTFELNESHWADAGTQAAEISVAEVDDLSEFRVYKQFGYFDKAAQSLAGYLSSHEDAPKELIFELCGLYLESGDLDGFVQSLESFHDSFARGELEDVVKMAFELDPNNLGLRVFAEKYLDWGVDEIAKNIVKEDSIEMPVEEEGRAQVETIEDEKKVEDAFKTGKQRKRAAYLARLADYKPLVLGFSRVKGINADERSTITSFLPEEKAARLLGKEVLYVTATNLYNRAIRSSKRPAAVVIDALNLDFQNRNIDNYAEHLWNLYFVLGKYGRIVKERMLGWGYSLGDHPVFTELGKNPDDIALRDLGVRFEYMNINNRTAKAKKMLPLVIEDVSQTAQYVGKGVNQAFSEAESQLMYGQIEEAISTLENGILAHPQESQLYSMLFDLYERSENWKRFEDFSVRVRSLGVELPEAVTIALSRLTQEMNEKAS